MRSPIRTDAEGRSRTGFTGAGLPARRPPGRHRASPAGPPGARQAAPLYMGFKSNLKGNQATEDAVTIASGDFARGHDDGRLLHDPQPRQLVRGAHRRRSASQRMYSPQTSDRRAAQAFTTDAESNPGKLNQAIQPLRRDRARPELGPGAPQQPGDHPASRLRAPDGRQSGRACTSSRCSATSPDFVDHPHADEPERAPALKSTRCHQRHQQQRRQRVHRGVQARQLRAARVAPNAPSRCSPDRAARAGRTLLTKLRVPWEIVPAAGLNAAVRAIAARRSSRSPRPLLGGATTSADSGPRVGRRTKLVRIGRAPVAAEPAPSRWPARASAFQKLSGHRRVDSPVTPPSSAPTPRAVSDPRLTRSYGELPQPPAQFAAALRSQRQRTITDGRTGASAAAGLHARAASRPTGCPLTGHRGRRRAIERGLPPQARPRGCCPSQSSGVRRHLEAPALPAAAAGHGAGDHRPRRAADDGARVARAPERDRDGVAHRQPRRRPLAQRRRAEQPTREPCRPRWPAAPPSTAASASRAPTPPTRSPPPTASTISTARRRRGRRGQHRGLRARAEPPRL